MQLYNIFVYLDNHHKAEMIFDDNDYSQFERQDWQHSVYATNDCGLKETKPSNIPKSRGKGMIMILYVDSDHTSDTKYRRSRTGFLVYLQCTLIYWSSKKQTSVETSSFGSEFMVMKTATEYVQGLRYKLQQIGIPIKRPTYVFGDNKSVLVNESKSDSVLKKNNKSIAYHHVCEGTERYIWRVAYISIDENQSDLMTKCIPFGEKKIKHCQKSFVFAL